MEGAEIGRGVQRSTISFIAAVARPVPYIPVSMVVERKAAMPAHHIASTLF
jgi:hypothetical protein